MVCSIFDSGGISTSDEFLKSDYFSRLKTLADFDSATKISIPEVSYAYHYPYLDFGISRIYGKFHYVIGMISNSKYHKPSNLKISVRDRSITRNKVKIYRTNFEG